MTPSASAASVPVMVGAYAALPPGPDTNAPARFVQGVLDLPEVDGLEVPLLIDDATDERWYAWTPPGRPSAVTLIPAFAIRSRYDARFGLSSTDAEGRQGALALVRRLHRDVRRWRDSGRELPIVALSSAPRVDDAPIAEDAFTASLHEIRGWDWGSTRIVVEHCDAVRTGHAPEKGYLPLWRELASIIRTDDAPTACGLAINWGRSVLEHRAVSGVRQDVQDAGERLAGIILSGVSDRETAYGPAWSDAHTPVVDDADTSGDSLLTRTQAVEAVTGLPRTPWYLAVKTSAQPADLSVQRRLAMLAPAVSIVASARPDFAHDGQNA